MKNRKLVVALAYVAGALGGAAVIIRYTGDGRIDLTSAGGGLFCIALGEYYRRR